MTKADEPITKTFPVLNMSCASCAASSQSTLQHQPGVLSASVNYANATARIKYIPSITSSTQLKAALQSVGYDLMTDESDAGAQALEAAQQDHYQSLKRNTTAAILLSIPMVIIGMFIMEMPFANYIMWALATPFVFYFGRQFYTSAWKQLQHGAANMDTLVALSTGVAYLFSVYNTVFPGYWHSRGVHAPVYFEAAAVVITFILLGRLLEEKAKGNTASAIKKLMGLQPKTVVRIDENGHQTEVEINTVTPGNLLLARQGESIAVDGRVQEGHSFVDESMISGEPVPVEKIPGSEVYAGTINQQGSFQFIAEKTGGDTVLAHIIQRVQEAQGSKAPVQKMVDKIAGIFVPVVIGIALLTLLLWVLLGGQHGFTQGLMAMVTVLIIACPCALGLATPTAIMVGVGKGAAHGILIRDAESLEKAMRINAVVLDKTGTITKGKPAVTGMQWLNNNAGLMPVLDAIEKQSTHPLATAVVKYLHHPETLTLTQLENIPGAGVKANYGNDTFFIGNLRLLEAHHINIDEALAGIAHEWSEQARTVVYFANAQHALAVIAIEDELKENAISAVKDLQDANIAVYMLTGDNAATAGVIAQQVGIQHFQAGVMPAQKAAFIQHLQAQGKVVAMVGDGINDSEALARADVSIAMGKGSDIAKEVARMIIISSDLTRIHQAIRLSRYTVQAIRQNLFWAFIYNLIGIPLAAGILYPVNGFLLNPMIAGGAMALSSVSVVANSLRLKWKPIA